MDDRKKCEHPACSCTAPEGQSYCSTSCEDAKGITELVCQCNHSECAGQELKP